MEFEVRINIEATKSEVVPTGQSVRESEYLEIRTRMTWLELQELKARLAPSSDV